MNVEITNDIIVVLTSAGLILAGKVIWDWLKGGSVGKQKTNQKTNGDTNKILLNKHNGTCAHHDSLINQNNKMSEKYDEVSKAINKIFLHLKESTSTQKEQNRRLDDIYRIVDKNFDETFERLRDVESEVKYSQGDIKALQERTSKGKE